MVSFRKSLMVLALLALCAGLASAAITPSCVTTGGTSVVRSEGVAELLNPITVTCVDTTAAAINHGTWTVTLYSTSTNITSPAGEVVLTSGVGEGATAKAGTVNANGSVVSFGQVAIFNSDIAPVAGQGTFSFTISGLRVNASGLTQGGPVFAAGVNFTLLAQPADIATPAGLFADSPITNLANVAYAIPTFSFTGASTTPNFSQCGSASADPTSSSPAFSTAFTVDFTELYSNAFKTAAEENYLDTGAGFATNGTRLAVNFANLPANTAVYVPGVATTGTITVTLVTGASADGSGGTVGGTTGGIQDANTSVYWFLATPGTPVFYQVTTSEKATIETIKIPAAVAFTGQPALTAGTAGSVTGSYAPVSSNALAATKPLPRFASTATKTFDDNLFSVEACTSTLLFPYVTTQSGWAVGLAVSNIGANPDQGVFGQTGTCDFTFYGANAPADPVTFGAAGFGDTTGIAPGTTAADGAAKAIGDGVVFTGYAYAVCNFRNSVGYAFIVGNTPNGVISNGYLTPTTSRRRN